MSQEITVRPATELDLDDIVAIDEKIGGKYRPDVWERRLTYALRRDPDASVVAVEGTKVVGFMLGEVRGGEFGLEESAGWIEVLGVDPEHRGGGVGRRMAEAMLAHFRSQGVATVRTLVDADMDGISSFFVALGFEPAAMKPYVMSL